MVMAFYPTDIEVQLVALVTKLDAPLKTRPEVHQNFRIDAFTSALPTSWAMEKKTQLKSLAITVISRRKNKG